MTKCKVGDVLWLVPIHAAGYEITVTKVGRKWAAFMHNSRFDIETGYVDGGQYQSPGRVFSSQDHSAEVALQASTWKTFKESVRLAHNLPPVKVIRDAARALGLAGW